MDPLDHTAAPSCTVFAVARALRRISPRASGSNVHCRAALIDHNAMLIAASGFATIFLTFEHRRK